MRKILFILGLALACSNMHAQKMLHTLSDDQLLHYGGFIGFNIPSYIVQPEEIYTPKVGFGVKIGGYVDLRVSKHLNLRVCPAFNANFINLQTITSDTIIEQLQVMPIEIPLYLKWSAERKGNYRPYVLGGGGLSCDISAFGEEESNILVNRIDYFAALGLGCDFYTEWFRCCPEIRYQIGFNNMLAEKNGDSWGKNGWTPHENPIFMQKLEKLIYHQVSIVFNFGSL